MNRYALVGHPLGHSFSQKFFCEKFQKENIKAEYINLDLEDISTIKDEINKIENIKGFNVTIPYKEAILPYLDDLDWGIRDLAAVNTVKVLESGAWKGYNTDVIGFERSIREVTDLDAHEHAIILGSGGASKAVQLAFQKYRVPYTVISRHPNKERFEWSYSDLTPEMYQESSIIINTTPLGMYPLVDACPDIDYAAITSSYLCMDLVYNPEETLFLQKCKAQGAQVLNGMPMLKYQAEAAWIIWNSED